MDVKPGRYELDYKQDTDLIVKYLLIKLLVTTKRKTATLYSGEIQQTEL